MLAERLRQAGYVTGAITGGGYLRPQFGFAQGIDRFVYWSERNTERELETGIERALDWLDNQRGRPFFLFFHKTRDDLYLLTDHSAQHDLCGLSGRLTLWAGYQNWLRDLAIPAA